MEFTRRTFMLAAAALGSTMSLPLPAFAQNSPSFEGKTIEIIVPFGEGGGTDVFARFVSIYLTRYLPGNPRIIVRNIPGGGSLIGTNEFAARARTDGTSVLIPSSSTFIAYLLGQQQVRFDLSTMRPAMIVQSGGVVYVPASLGISSVAELGELQGRELVYSAVSPTSVDLVPMLAFLTLGLDVRFVFGMAGGNDSRLAFERGETSIAYQSTPTYLANVQPLVETGEVVPLFSWGVIGADGNVERDPSFPELPHFIEAAEIVLGEQPSGPAFEAYKAYFAAGFGVARPVLLPQGTPDEIVAAYHAALSEAAADPEFMATSETLLGSYTPAIGDAAEAVMRGATSTTPENQEWVRNYLRDTHNASL